ncbi:MAG: enoyl-CoA hydratase-related protein [Hyphomicrobiales bacterium]
MRLEAQRIGLVHDVVPLAELQAAGARIVASFLENGPLAIAETKAVALDLAGMAIDQATFDRLVDSQAAKRQSREAAEGLASFVEKRPARWDER